MRPVLELSNGAKLLLDKEAHVQDRDQSYSVETLDQVLPAIAGLCQDLVQAIRLAGPDRAKVEFGINLEVERSSLLAVLCNSYSDAAELKLTLEWDAQPPS